MTSLAHGIAEPSTAARKAEIRSFIGLATSARRSRPVPWGGEGGGGGEWGGGSGRWGVGREVTQSGNRRCLYRRGGYRGWRLDDLHVDSWRGEHPELNQEGNHVTEVAIGDVQRGQQCGRAQGHEEYRGEYQ